MKNLFFLKKGLPGLLIGLVLGTTSLAFAVPQQAHNIYGTAKDYQGNNHVGATITVRLNDSTSDTQIQDNIAGGSSFGTTATTDNGDYDFNLKMDDPDTAGVVEGANSNDVIHIFINGNEVNETTDGSFVVIVGGSTEKNLTTPEPDSDGDGVLDSQDGCPSDANKTAAGTCGCGTADTDTDGDGTPDCNDGCVNDANKTAAGTCGCGVADTDTDGDGTPDCNDDCANDPAKTTAGVCGCGVPDHDSDGDGTLDCNDGCANDANKTVAGTCGCGVADDDSDGDGVLDCNDNCPDTANADQSDVDNDSFGDVCDNDADNDGHDDTTDDCDPTDATKWSNAAVYQDSDGDGFGAGAADTNQCYGSTLPSGTVDNNTDNCPTVSNPDQTDTDSDSQGDACDTDDDGDGVADSADCAPLDSTLHTTMDVLVDEDGDRVGTGSTVKQCTNGSTAPAGYTAYTATIDNCPAIPNPITPPNTTQTDTDSDGIGDPCDKLADGSDASDQANEVVIPTATSGLTETVIIKTQSGGDLSAIMAKRKEDFDAFKFEAGIEDSSFELYTRYTGQTTEFSYGFFGFTVNGASEAVDITLPAGATPSSYWKYDKANKTWFDFTCAGNTYTAGTPCAEIHANVITLHLEDNGVGDNDATANVIVDPGAPGFAVAASGLTATGGSTSCFIATAAFGTPWEKHVMTLRIFRDRFLLPSAIGKKFVQTYYRLSPPVADFIADHNGLRAMVRGMLYPVVGVSSLMLAVGPLWTACILLLGLVLLSGTTVWIIRRR